MKLSTDILTSMLRRLAQLSAAIVGAGLLAMMLVTCADVVLRKIGHPFSGAYDNIKVAAAMALACAMVVIVTLYHLLHPGKALLNP